ncbi:MAG: hypothetical protein ABIF12_02530 [bacterium]
MKKILLFILISQFYLNTTKLYCEKLDKIIPETSRGVARLPKDQAFVLNIAPIFYKLFGVIVGEDLKENREKSDCFLMEQIQQKAVDNYELIKINPNISFIESIILKYGSIADLIEDILAGKVDLDQYVKSFFKPFKNNKDFSPSNALLTYVEFLRNIILEDDIPLVLEYSSLQTEQENKIELIKIFFQEIVNRLFPYNVQESWNDLEIELLDNISNSFLQQEEKIALDGNVEDIIIAVVSEISDLLGQELNGNSGTEKITIEIKKIKDSLMTIVYFINALSEVINKKLDFYTNPNGIIFIKELADIKDLMLNSKTRTEFLVNYSKLIKFEFTVSSFK